MVFSTFWLYMGLCLLAITRAAVLENFQVTNPVPVPKDGQSCTVQVLQHDFALSFGEGKIVSLAPPTDCGEPGSWAAVTLNLTVTSSGRQYDRLGIFTYHNVEIWRTSTPEPTADGIIWTYIKDVTQYTPLFAENGTFILEIDNLVDDTYTGIYHATVSATYYTSSEEYPPAPKADAIIPLTTLLNTTGNQASVPPSFSINVTIPVNTVELYAEILATGNGQEEFWYSNAPDAYLTDLPTYGKGPFREVRLLIDGVVAGVVFPFAPIYTGGFIPSMWRPIAAYGSLEVPTYSIDVTPFVPLLTDEKNHTFTIDVISAEDDHAILSNWFVSGLLQVITDKDSTEATTGTALIVYEAGDYPVATVTGNIADNGDVDFSVAASRSLRIESEIVSGSGKKSHVVWSQELLYSNSQNWTENTNLQVEKQLSSGKSFSMHDEEVAVLDEFSYPLNFEYLYLSDEQTNWTTTIDHSYDRVLLPNPLRLQTTTNVRQITDGFFQIQAGGNYGNGTNNNTFSYSDSAGNTYSRKVNAAYNNITLDEEEGSLAAGNLVQLPFTVQDTDTLSRGEVSRPGFVNRRI